MLTIFSTTSCSSCKTLKYFLSKKGISYKEVLVDNDPDTRQMLFDKTGYHQVPVTSDGENFISGMNLSAILGMVN